MVQYGVLRTLRRTPYSTQFCMYRKYSTVHPECLCLVRSPSPSFFAGPLPWPSVTSTPPLPGTRSSSPSFPNLLPTPHWKNPFSSCLLSSRWKEPNSLIDPHDLSPKFTPAVLHPPVNHSFVLAVASFISSVWPSSTSGTDSRPPHYGPRKHLRSLRFNCTSLPFSIKGTRPSLKHSLHSTATARPFHLRPLSLDQKRPGRDTRAAGSSRVWDFRVR